MESFDFTEAHYCSLESQSNVYSIGQIDLPNGLHKVLIASLRGVVASTEFQNSRPVSREVQFTYIPGTTCWVISRLQVHTVLKGKSQSS